MTATTEEDPSQKLNHTGDDSKPSNENKDLRQKEKEYTPPPDGGWGWMVVLGSFMIHVITDGMTYSLGELFTVLLEKYNAGNGATSVIMSTLPGVTLCSGPIASAFVNRYGCRSVTIAGSVIAACFILASMYATNVIQLIITIGFGTGIGFGLIYLPAIVSVTCYFEKYRSIATGIAVCGSGVGTAIFAPLLKVMLNSDAGISGTFFVIALLVLTCVFYGMLFRPLPDSTATALETDAVKHNVNPEMVPLTVVTPASNDEEEYDDTAKNQQQQQQKTTPRPIDKRHNLGVLYGGGSQHKLNGVYNSTTSLKSSGSGIMYRKDVFLYTSSKSIADVSRSNGHLDANKTTPHVTSKENLALQTQEKSKFSCCPQSAEFKHTLNEMMDFSVLKNPIFIIFATSNFLTSIGYNIPYIYIPAQAKDKEMNPYLSGVLLSAVGVGNTVGRIVLGYICDKPWVNRLYVYNTCLSICGLATVISIVCEEAYSFLVFCFIYGFTTGAYVGLTSVVTADLMGLDKLTNAFGLILLFQGIATLIGPPIAGALCDYMQYYSKTHNIAFILAGLSIAISGLMLFLISPLETCLKRRLKPKNKNRDVRKIYKKPECNGV